MATPAPDAVKRLADARDIPELGSANSDCVPGLTNAKSSSPATTKEEQLRLTAGHQAEVEEKPEVRKAGGVRACA